MKKLRWIALGGVIFGIVVLGLPGSLDRAHRPPPQSVYILQRAWTPEVPDANRGSHPERKVQFLYGDYSLEWEQRNRLAWTEREKDEPWTQLLSAASDDDPPPLPDGMPTLLDES